jgi:uncharacterized protein (TIGR00369 family)
MAQKSAWLRSFERLARARMRQSPATRMLGFELESLRKGRSVLRLRVQSKHIQIHGVVHGGILTALADTAAAMAAYTVVPPGAELATVELKINFLEAVPGGTVWAKGKVLRAGRNFVITECEIRGANRRLAAKALLTFGAPAGRLLNG